MHDWQFVGKTERREPEGSSRPGYSVYVSWRCSRCGNWEQHEYKPDDNKRYFYPNKTGNKDAGVYRDCDEIVIWSVMES